MRTAESAGLLITRIPLAVILMVAVIATSSPARADVGEVMINSARLISGPVETGTSSQLTPADGFAVPTGVTCPSCGVCGALQADAAAHATSTPTIIRLRIACLPPSVDPRA